MFGYTQFYLINIFSILCGKGFYWTILLSLGLMQVVNFSGMLQACHHRRCISPVGFTKLLSNWSYIPACWRSDLMQLSIADLLQVVESFTLSLWMKNLNNQHVSSLFTTCISDAKPCSTLVNFLSWKHSEVNYAPAPSSPASLRISLVFTSEFLLFNRFILWTLASIR